MTVSPLTHRRPINQAEADAEPRRERVFPEPAAYPNLTIQTTVVDPDGFVWTVTFADTSLAAAADVLKKRGCRPAAPAPSSAPSAAPAAPSGAPCCPTHNRPMKAMQRPDKQGHTHMCTAKVGDSWCDQRA